MKTTYQLTVDSPPPMDVAAYGAKLATEWPAMLDRVGVSEADIQRFLEQHPSLLPRPSGLIQGGHHLPHFDALVTQPRLVGYESRTPDFLWVASDSAAVTAVFIEIEAPNKPWWTKVGKPCSQLTHAISQLQDWKRWFDETTNQQSFRRFYEIDSFLNGRAFRQHYVLIYGRRAEANASPESTSRRNYLERDGRTTIMTFDRLAFTPDLCRLPTIRFRTQHDQRRKELVHVPPTFVVGPDVAQDLATLHGREAAIDRCEWMTPERRKFLKERLPYWDKWAAQKAAATLQGRFDFVRAGDCE